mmetsp:Transcript_3482/g.12271  ORF Transcript_3482/g.12271 Transcript_3482/m.12271 type:complete len:204 (+) Transcript_3482:975-1586(+)
MFFFLLSEAKVRARRRASHARAARWTTRAERSRPVYALGAASATGEAAPVAAASRFLLSFRRRERSCSARPGVTTTVKGLPAISSPASVTCMRYSPLIGAVYVTAYLPLLSSWIETMGILEVLASPFFFWRNSSTCTFSPPVLAGLRKRSATWTRKEEGMSETAPRTPAPLTEQPAACGGPASTLTVRRTSSTPRAGQAARTW